MARIDDKGRGTSAVGGAGGMGRASASGGGSRGGVVSKLKTKMKTTAQKNADRKVINKKGAEGPKKSPKSNVKVIPKNAKVMKKTPPAKNLAEAARYTALAKARSELLNMRREQQRKSK